MAHFYEITSKHSAFFREDIHTPHQARKEWLTSGRKLVASVTEKLKVFPNPFFESWRVSEAIHLARKHQHVETSTIAEMLWGIREHPITGQEVSSSVWGTECHKQLELAIKNQWRANEWEPFVQPFVDWTNGRDFQIMETETIIASDKPSFNVAGTIDLLGKLNDRVALFDYKTRTVAEGQDIKRKAYAKDCMQLASEGHMVREMMHLDYDPKIFTVIIDTRGGETHVKEWTKKSFDKSLSDAISCFTFYDEINGL
jgi:ATP-dependent exoDNAse (exonuclease V) beta subunit